MSFIVCMRSISPENKLNISGLSIVQPSGTSNVGLKTKCTKQRNLPYFLLSHYGIQLEHPPLKKHFRLDGSWRESVGANSLNAKFQHPQLQSASCKRDFEPPLGIKALLCLRR